MIKRIIYALFALVFAAITLILALPYATMIIITSIIRWLFSSSSNMFDNCMNIVLNKVLTENDVNAIVKLKNNVPTKSYSRDIELDKSDIYKIVKIRKVESVDGQIIVADIHSTTDVNSDVHTVLLTYLVKV